MHRVQTLDKGESTGCNVKGIWDAVRLAQLPFIPVKPTVVTPLATRCLAAVIHSCVLPLCEMNTTMSLSLCALPWGGEGGLPYAPDKCPTYPGLHGSNGTHSHSWTGLRQNSERRQTSQPQSQTSLCMWCVCMCVWCVCMCVWCVCMCVCMCVWCVCMCMWCVCMCV